MWMYRPSCRQEWEHAGSAVVSSTHPWVYPWHPMWIYRWGCHQCWTTSWTASATAQRQPPKWPDTDIFFWRCRLQSLPPASCRHLLAAHINFRNKETAWPSSWGTNNVGVRILAGASWQHINFHNKETARPSSWGTNNVRIKILASTCWHHTNFHNMEMAQPSTWGTNNVRIITVWSWTQVYTVSSFFPLLSLVGSVSSPHDEMVKVSRVNAQSNQITFKKRKSSF